MDKKTGTETGTHLINANKDDNIQTKRANIVASTPSGQDPLVYWHQVAQDAIQSARKEHEHAVSLLRERDKAETELKYFTERLVERTAQAKSSIPFDISRLIEKTQDGDIDLSISLYISGKEHEK